ncbi:uncharacterized protein G2W53_013811 [Senna tora]|uniref:HAT C-terminal dimerisation domain-containing protein n=1 Tax=Senna tora TaxID=362788 RepID=A0A834TZB1_9FABA|nr:uncharacterized protein G2W53_013811 [Senna tora]
MSIVSLPLLSSARRLCSSSKASLLCSKASSLTLLEGFFSSSARTVSRCCVVFPLVSDLVCLNMYERKDENEESSFYDVVHGILIERWTKSSTPLHCLAHSLNPRYYSYDWLSKDPRRVPPYQDSELSFERIKCLKRYFPNSEDRRKVNIEFANFSDGREGFKDIDSLNDRSAMDAKTWWLVHGVHAPILQKIALKLLGQPSSSSCCERNWGTYSFIHSVRRNKMKPKRAEDLVYVHTNLRLLSRKSPQYKTGESRTTRTWKSVDIDIAPAGLRFPTSVNGALHWLVSFSFGRRESIEYGVEDSWTKIYSIDFSCNILKPFGSNLPVKLFKKGAAILMYNSSSGLFFYHECRWTRFKCFVVRGTQFNIEAFAHIPSLISPKDVVKGDVEVQSVHSRCAAFKLPEEDDVLLHFSKMCFPTSKQSQPFNLTFHHFPHNRLRRHYVQRESPNDPEIITVTAHGTLPKRESLPTRCSAGSPPPVPSIAPMLMSWTLSTP